MKKMKRLSIFLLIGLLIFSLFAPACGESAQEKGVNAIDAYMQEIRDMDLEYSLVLIEREAEQGKQAIMQAEDEAEIRKIKNYTLRAMKALVLTDEEALSLKRLYLKGKEPTESTKIRYYFGKYEGYHESYHIFVIHGYFPNLDLPIMIEGYTFWDTITGCILVCNGNELVGIPTLWDSRLVDILTIADLYYKHKYVIQKEGLK